MSETRIHVRTIHEASAAVGLAGPRTVTIDRPKEAGGMGAGFNGGELLFLALGACYCNDIYREASRIGISVRSVQIDVTGDWGGEPVRARNVRFSPRVEAEASATDIEKLIKHTDSVAEVHNSLRLGTPVELASFEAVSV